VDAIQLDELDYLRLVLRRSHVDGAMLEAQKVMAEAERNVKATGAAFKDALKIAAEKYGFDAEQNYSFDDDTHRLIPE
jgi:hypothetical protein